MEHVFAKLKRYNLHLFVKSLKTDLTSLLYALCSYFKMLQIDVFWPLLLLYFAGLALYTISKILRTMDRYRYSLADFQKGSTQTFRP